MFNGRIPIILDSLKQHYFIDRDGEVFRHILNFLRTDRLNLPADYTELELLAEEANFYSIFPLITALEEYKHDSSKNNDENMDCVVLSVCSEVCERVLLSCERALLEAVIPELTAALNDSRTSGWVIEQHVIRFPVNGYCRLNAVQILQRLFAVGFSVVASNGGGVEGQQFSEYLLSRKARGSDPQGNPSSVAVLSKRT